MQIKQPIIDAVNKQINTELQASYNYLAMASYFSSLNLDGFATWMQKQAQEEIGHGMRLFSYLHERDVRVSLVAIAAPNQAWGSPLEAFEEAYQNEVAVSNEIYKIVTLADQEQEYSMRPILNWLLQEQIEEESTALTILEKMRLVGKEPSGLLFMDKELGARQQ